MGAKLLNHFILVFPSIGFSTENSTTISHSRKNLRTGRKKFKITNSNNTHTNEYNNNMKHNILYTKPNDNNMKDNNSQIIRKHTNLTLYNPSKRKLVGIISHTTLTKIYYDNTIPAKPQYPSKLDPAKIGPNIMKQKNMETGTYKSNIPSNKYTQLLRQHHSNKQNSDIATPTHISKQLTTSYRKNANIIKTLS